jgi:hypothetical protein
MLTKESASRKLSTGSDKELVGGRLRSSSTSSDKGLLSRTSSESISLWLNSPKTWEDPWNFNEKTGFQPNNRTAIANSASASSSSGGGSVDRETRKLDQIDEDKDIVEAGKTVELTPKVIEFKDSAYKHRLSMMNNGRVMWKEDQKVVLVADKSAKYSDKVYAVMKELFATEGSYVNSLKVMMEEYWASILAEREYIRDVNDLRILLLYQNLREILIANEYFLEDLYFIDVDTASEKSVKGVLEKLSEVMRDYSHIFKIYGQYGQNYAIGKEMIAKICETSDRFKKLLNNLSFRPRCSGNTLQSFLIMPIQRLPRYCLLLREIMKALPAEDPINKMLQEAHDSIESTTEFLNFMIQEREDREHLIHMERYFSTPTMLLKKNRKFIRSSTLIKFNRRSKKQRTIFLLFNDLLVYASEKDSEGLEERNRISFEDIISCDVEDSSYYEDYPVFSLKTNQKSFVVGTQSIEQRDEWIEDINKFMEKNRQRSNSLAKKEENLSGNSKSGRCPICQSLFFFRKSYQCETCLKKICSKCSNKKDVTSTINPLKKARVCIKCDKTEDHSNLKKNNILSETINDEDFELEVQKLNDELESGRSQSVSELIQDEERFVLELENMISAFINPFAAMIMRSKIKFKKGLPLRFEVPAPVAGISNVLIQTLIIHSELLRELRMSRPVESCLQRFFGFLEIHESLFNVLCATEGIFRIEPISKLTDIVELSTGRTIDSTIRLPIFRLNQLYFNCINLVKEKQIPIDLLKVLEKKLDFMKQHLHKKMVAEKALLYIENTFHADEPIELLTSDQDYIDEGFIQIREDQSWSICYFHLFSERLIISSPNPVPGGWIVFVNVDTKEIQFERHSTPLRVNLMISKGTKDERILKLKMFDEEELMKWVTNFITVAGKRKEKTSRMATKNTQTSLLMYSQMRLDRISTAPRFKTTEKKMQMMSIIEVIDPENEPVGALASEQKPSMTPAAPIAATADDLSLWNKYTLESGVEFWIHAKTGQATFVNPDPSIQWSRHFDVSGTEFFYNKFEGRSTYRKPKTFDSPQQPSIQGLISAFKTAK